MKTLCGGLLSAFLVVLTLGTHHAHALGTANTNVMYSTVAPTTQIQQMLDQVGYCGATMGTPISSNCFAASLHNTGSIGDTFMFRGVAYKIIDYVDTVSSQLNLRIWRVEGTFPAWSEITDVKFDHPLIIIGNGQRQGEPLMYDKVSTNWVAQTNVTTVVDSYTVATTNVTPALKTNYLTVVLPKKDAALVKLLIPSVILTPIPPKGVDVTVSVPIGTSKTYTTNVTYASMPITNEVVTVTQTQVTSTNSALRGYKAGIIDGFTRWATGMTVKYNTNYVVSPFDLSIDANVGAVFANDSGGAWFMLDDDGIWKLVGITAGNQSPWSETPGGPKFDGSFVDIAGLYRGTSLIKVSEPTRSFATRLMHPAIWPTISTFINTPTGP